MLTCAVLLAFFQVSGPSDVWFGVGFDATLMDQQPYAIIVDGHGSVTERQLAKESPGTQLQQSVKVVSSTVAAGIRTVSACVNVCVRACVNVCVRACVCVNLCTCVTLCVRVNVCTCGSVRECARACVATFFFGVLCACVVFWLGVSSSRHPLELLLLLVLVECCTHTLSIYADVRSLPVT